MLINKPCCDFKMCRNHFDGNCINTTEYERCSYNRQKAEIEELRADNNYLFETMPHMKAEAIKEFAERLKNCFCISAEYVDIMNIIDNIVKEMTEPVKLEHNSLCETETYIKE